jgi:uncharacterized membrane protein
MAGFLSSFAAGRPRKAKPAENWRRYWPWIVFGLVVLALCFAWLLLPLRAWMDALQSWFVGRGALGVAIFALVLVVATFLPLPDWPLPIAAGYVYGVWAFPLVYVGIAVPSAILPPAIWRATGSAPFSAAGQSTAPSTKPSPNRAGRLWCCCG